MHKTLVHHFEAVGLSRIICRESSIELWFEDRDKIQSSLDLRDSFKRIWKFGTDSIFSII